jgi:hypothetical protein
VQGLGEDGARVALVGCTQEALDRAAEGLTERASPDAVGLVANINVDGGSDFT